MVPEVTVELPATRASVRLARLTVADAAARAGLPVDAVDKLSVAAGEAFESLVRSTPGAVLTLSVSSGAGAVEVAAGVRGAVPSLSLRTARPEARPD